MARARPLIPMLLAALLLLAASGMARAGFYDGIVLSDNPIGYWRLGEPAGAAQALDSTSYNRPLNYTGFAAADYGRPGAIVSDLDTAMRFTTAKPTISSPNTTDFAFAAGQSFSVEYWLRVAAGNASDIDAGIITKGYNTTTQATPWYLSRYNKSNNGGKGSVDFFLRNSASASKTVASTGSVTLNDDEWHHVVGIYDSSMAELRLYVDAILQGTVAGVPLDAYGMNSRPLFVGNHYNRALDGQLDELAIYGVALDNMDGVGGIDADSRVLAHYVAGQVVGPEPATLGLLALGALGLLRRRRC